MKTIIANNNQTLFDISLQEYGSIEGVWDLVDANPGLSIDLSVAAGTRLNVPGNVLNQKVVDYYSRNGIKPATGLGEELVVTKNDMNTIPQDLNYDLAQGSHDFAAVRLFFLVDLLTVQISYEDLSTDTVIVRVDQSLDGVTWTPVPYVAQVLDKDVPAHTFNIVGLLTDYVRLHIEVPDPTTGTIKSVIWKT